MQCPRTLAEAAAFQTCAQAIGEMLRTCAHIVVGEVSRSGKHGLGEGLIEGWASTFPTGIEHMADSSAPDDIETRNTRIKGAFKISSSKFSRKTLQS